MQRKTHTHYSSPRRGRLPPLHAALKAFLAQLCGGGIAFLVLWLGWLTAQVWALVAVQAVVAAVVASALRCERWWIVIHLAFMPLVVAAQQLDISPAWYLTGFLLLVAVYWTSFRTRVPLFLTNGATTDAVARLIRDAAPLRIVDIGCGTGSMLVKLARHQPDCSLTGIECAPLPYALSRLRAIGLPNLHIMSGDFFAQSWRDYDLVYAFLSPVPMSAVWAKVQQELAPGSLLVSNSFPIEGVSPSRIITVEDKRCTQLFVYLVDKRDRQAQEGMSETAELSG